MKKVNSTSIQTPSININYSANGVELKIQGCKIDCPATDVAEVTKSYFDGMNRSMEESFMRMGINITKVGSILNQLLNFGDENISKLVKVASKGVDELLGNEEPAEVETASKDRCQGKHRVILILDRKVDPRLIPIESKQYGLIFEHMSEAQDFLKKIADKFGKLKVTVLEDEAELPLIRRGIINVSPEKGRNLHFRSIHWRIEVI